MAFPARCRRVVGTGTAHVRGRYFLLAVRTGPRQPGCMTNPNAQKFTRALEAKGPARRSALYRWLHAHHAALSRSLDRPDRSWVEAAGLITAEGLFGANGKPISPKALRQMWLRVVRDVERERAAKPAEPDRPKPHRSRPAGSWSPPWRSCRHRRRGRPVHGCRSRWK